MFLNEWENIRFYFLPKVGGNYIAVANLSTQSTNNEKIHSLGWHVKP